MRFGLKIVLITGMVAATGVADEPVRRGPLKQRVSPKLLREAMATPEYRARMAAQNSVSLGDLQALADKLKQNGDADGASLLQRYIQEHGRSAKSSVNQSANVGKLIVHCHIFELKLSDIPRDTVFHGAATNPDAIHHELDQLVSEGKAKLCLDPRLVDAKSNVPLRCFADGEFPLALHNGKSAKIEVRDCRSMVEILPTITENQRVNIQLKLVSGNVPVATAETLTPTNSDAAKCDASCQLEMNFDEAFVHALNHPKPGYGLFVVIETTPR